MKKKKGTSKSLRMVVMIMSLVLMLVAVVIVSFAWFRNENRANTEQTEVSSSTTPTINAQIPDSFISTELFSGQTGIEYGTEDMPYVLEYTPVVAEAKYLPNDDYFMQAEVCGIKISLSEKDHDGNNVVEVYDLNTIEGIEMVSHFTYRLKLTQIQNSDEVLLESPNLTYRPQNGYLVTDDSDEEPLNLVNGNFYYFDLHIIFQSEEGYNLLMESQQPISEDYTFPLSNPKYMFSKMSIFFNVGLDELYKVNFNTNGGTCEDAYIKTTGAGTFDLPTPTKDGAVFAGWYYDSECTKIFTEDSLVNEPIQKDITIYAKYYDDVDVTFNFTEPYGELTTQTVAVEYNSSATALTKEDIKTSWSDKYDYVLTGWKASGASEDFDFTQKITEPVTLIGQWEQKSKIKVNLHTKRDSALVPAKIKRYASYSSNTVEYSYDKGETVTIYISDGTSLSNYLSQSKSSGIFRAEPTSGFKEFNKWQDGDGDINLNDILYVSGGTIDLYADYKL